MDAFSPVGARFATDTPPTGHQGDKSVDSVKTTTHAPNHHVRSSATRPSGLSNVTTLEEEIASSANSNKRTFPLLERLQSAIRSIEERTPIKVGEEEERRSRANDLLEQPTFVQQTRSIPPHEPFDHSRIEKLIELSHRHLYDQLQTDLHSLHMDLLKQCLAMQVNQERLLKMYLPQVKELAEELRCLRDENARLRARLQYQ